jgi:hypothetical protein
MEVLLPVVSRDSPAVVATGYPLNDQGSIAGRGNKRFSAHYPTASRPALGPTQPPIQCVSGVNRQESKTDHSPPFSAEEIMVELYFHSPIRLDGVVLNLLSTVTTLLAHFPYFDKIKVGLCDLHAVCVSVNPPPINF